MILTGNLVLDDPKNITFSASEAISYWNQDFDKLIIAGCSVLKIKNYNYKFPHDPGRQKASPGEIWAKLTGKILMGYCAKAPLDSQAGPDTTKNILKKFLELGGKPEDWLAANNDTNGRSACVIDTSSTPWRYGYIFKKWFSHNVFWKTFDHSKNQWPEE